MVYISNRHQATPNHCLHYTQTTTEELIAEILLPSPASRIKMPDLASHQNSEPVLIAETFDQK